MRILFALLLFSMPTFVLAQDRDEAWRAAYRQGPMSAEETRAFMKALAKYVFDNQLRMDTAPMRGMVYEWLFCLEGRTRS